MHRLSYELFVGPIPDELVIDHKCYNPPCVNPDHLQVVTFRDNMVKFGRTNIGAVHARKTHCPQGHPYDERNTCFTGRGRQCRACQRIRTKERYYLLKDQSLITSIPNETI